MKKIIFFLFSYFILFSSSLFSKEQPSEKNWYEFFWQKKFYVELEGHISNFSDDTTRSILLGTIGYGGRVGYKLSQWRVYFHIEQNYWHPIELESNFDPGVLNFGFGTNFLFFKGKMQSSFTVGLSYLLFDTLLDEKGEMGLYLDIRPLGFRFNVFNERFFINLNPISFVFINPVRGEIPIRMKEYRTILALEFLL